MDSLATFAAPERLLPGLLTTPAWDAAGAAQQLTILIPTHDRDVRPLCRELLADMAGLAQPAAVGLALLVDGNPALADQAAMLAEAEAMGLAAAFWPAPINLGRSAARNALARLAPGRFLLFLDADSLPDAPGFVGRALALARDPAQVSCGGRSGRRAGPAPADCLLYETHSRLREWVPAAERNRFPDLAFVSANFVVERQLFLDEPFDPGFTGWGWEDMEWAMRISARARVVHVDNTVTHDEHHRDRVWVARLEASAANFARLRARHPALVARLRLVPLIRLLRPVAGWSWLPAVLRFLALARPLPPRFRLLALKALQAACFARAG